MINEILSNPDIIPTAYNLIDGTKDVLMALPNTDISQIIEATAQINYNVDIPGLSYVLEAIENLHQQVFVQGNWKCWGSVAIGGGVLGGLLSYFANNYKRDRDLYIP